MRVMTNLEDGFIDSLIFSLLCISPHLHLLSPQHSVQVQVSYVNMLSALSHSLFYFSSEVKTQRGLWRVSELPKS